MELVDINSTDLRIRTREIIERVRFKGERFRVLTFGQPSAVIISVEEYQEMRREYAERMKSERHGASTSDLDQVGDQGCAKSVGPTTVDEVTEEKALQPPSRDGAP